MKIAGNKQQGNKKMIIAIASAVAVVAIIVILIVCLSGGKNDPDKNGGTTSTTTTTTTQPPVTAVGISIEGAPKTEYYIGEELDISGLIIKVEMSDGSSELVEANDPELQVGGFDSTFEQVRTLTVSYKGFTAELEISITRAPVVVEGTVTGISIVSTPKTYYIVGDTFDQSGIKIAVKVAERDEPYYIEGNYPGVEVTGFDSSTPNDALTLTVSFEGCSATYNVAIKDPSYAEYVILGLNVASKPKTEYYVGEEFDITGLRVQVLTDKQATTFFVDASDEKLTLSGFDSSVAVENQIITVTYEGVSTTFTVNIKEKPAPAPTLESIEVVDLISTYTLEKWNLNGLNIYGAYLKLTYSDGTVKGSYETTPLLWEYVEPLSKADAPGTTEVVINYSEAGVLKSVTVTITITE